MTPNSLNARSVLKIFADLQFFVIKASTPWPFKHPDHFLDHSNPNFSRSVHGAQLQNHDVGKGTITEEVSLIFLALPAN